MIVLRTVILAVFIYLGFLFGQLLSSWGFLGSPINFVYLMLVGLLLGLLFAPRIENIIKNISAAVRAAWENLPPELPLALTVAVTLALIISVLLTTLLSSIPGFSWYHSLFIATILVAVFAVLATKNMRYFAPHVKDSGRKLGGKALDSSVLIDGRIADMAEMGWLEGKVWVPRFILRELQLLSDHENPVKRGKGRRGMETIERLRKHCDLEIIDEDNSNQKLTDDKLLDLCRERGMSLVTNDAAMVQMARIYGVRAQSIQELSIALRTQYRPGDKVKLEIVKPGREAGQGVGYLEDGTMVVVDDAAHMRGKKVPVVITQTIQTQVGRLVFARLQSDEEPSLED